MTLSSSSKVGSNEEAVQSDRDYAAVEKMLSKTHGDDEVNVTTVPSKRTPTPATCKGATSKRKRMKRDKKEAKKRCMVDAVSDAALPVVEEDVNNNDQDEQDGAIKQKGLNESKLLFARRWSEQDEIGLIKGMIELNDMIGTNPADDQLGYYEYLKQFITFDASKDQFRDKIKRMRMKDENNAFKKKVFTSTHEQMIFDLSKTIWGATAAIAGVEEGSFEAKGVADISDSLCYSQFIQHKDSIGMMFSANLLKDRMELLDDDVKKELDGKWEKLLVSEAKLSYKRLSLMRRQIRLILNVNKA